MRFGMMGMVTMLAAATAGMAHGERENRGLSPIIPQRAETGTIKKLGVCHLVPMIEDAPPPAREAGDYVLNLGGEAFGYFRRYENREVRGTITVRILQKPEHGVLDDRGGGHFAYFPNAGYLGKDKAIFEIEYAGERLQIVHFFRSIDGGTDGMEEKYCPKGTRFWKISLPTTSPTLDNSALQALLDATGINNSVTVNTADLTGGAVGQTTGSSITLDTNAAGYNWYIDYTPYLNDEYLPTSNPNLWVAKEGSEAAGNGKTGDRPRFSASLCRSHLPADRPCRAAPASPCPASPCT